MGVGWYMKRLAIAASKLSNSLSGSELGDYFLSNFRMTWLRGDNTCSWLTEGKELALRVRLTQLTDCTARLLHFLVERTTCRPLALIEVTAGCIDPATQAPHPHDERSVGRMQALFRKHQALPWPPPQLCLHAPPTRRPTSAELTALPLTHVASVDPDEVGRLGHLGVRNLSYLADAASRQFISVPAACDWDLVATQCYAHWPIGALARDELHFHTRLLSLTDQDIHLLHFVLKAHSGELAATFEIVGRCVSQDLLLYRALPAEVSLRLRVLLAEHASLPWPAPAVSSVAGVIKSAPP